MDQNGQPATPPTPVPRSIRAGYLLLAALLTLLIVWLLGFVLGDLGDIEGPDYSAVFEEYVDESLQRRAGELERQIAEIEQSVARQQELQQDLKRSMDNARGTMQQVMDLHRLSLEQQVAPTGAEKEALASAQQRFLRAQDRFEAANAEIAASNETKFELRQELQSVRVTTGEQELPAQEEFQRRSEAHQFRVATLKLLFIVPLFVLSAWLFWRYRESAYRPALLALLVASFWKLGGVMFEHFPLEFFKYVAIVAAIAIVLSFLVFLLRKAVRPSRELLLDRYREAYRAHVCPVCAFPIARGPLRFALWTRSGPQPTSGDASTQGGASHELPYVCPSCGTELFASCRGCDSIRHSLLPFCEHCGAESFQ